MEEGEQDIWARYEKRAHKKKKTPRVTSHPLLSMMTSERPNELANLIVIDVLLNFVGRVNELVTEYGSASSSMTDTRKHLSTSLVRSCMAYYLSLSSYSRTRSS